MSDRPVLRIGEVARRTGVAVSTLRAWERRYGLLEPTRTDGGHRLYRDADVQRVRAMQRLLDEGWTASEAAREVRDAPAPVTPLVAIAGGDPAADLGGRLRDAFTRYDAAAADRALDDAFARLDVAAVVDEVIVPTLRWLGTGWEDDPELIAREHAATNVLRPRLLRLLRVSPGVAGRVCVAAAPEQEEHDLGLLLASATAATAGWRVHFLGARTPAAALERAVAALDPAVVLLAAIDRGAAAEWLTSPPDVGRAAVVLGGAGFADGEGFADGDAGGLGRAVVHLGGFRDLPATLDRAARERGTA